MFIVCNVDFTFVGYGWCRPQCYFKTQNRYSNSGQSSNESCRINGYRKESSNYDECKSTCENNLHCTGFAITDSAYRYALPGDITLNECYIYGNFSSNDVINTTRPDLWIQHFHSSPYGYKVYSSSIPKPDYPDQWGTLVRCFKRFEEESKYKG